MAADPRIQGPKLLGKGTEVVLGGAPVRLIFDNRALVQLEREWGSLKAFADELQKGQDGKMFTCISSAIAASARGLPAQVDPVDLIDVSRIIEYAEAITVAFEEAMPEAAEQGVGSDRPLTGAPSTISESSASEWHPPTSG